MAEKKHGKHEALWTELRGFAQQLGVEVRCEKLLGDTGYRVRSGSCSVHGKKVILLDRNLPVRDRIDVLAEELRENVPAKAELPPDLQKILN